MVQYAEEDMKLYHNLRLLINNYLYFSILSQGPANAAQDPNCLLAASETQQDDSLLVITFFSVRATIM